MRFTKIFPNLPSRAGRIDFTLYNWFLNLSRWLRATLADISTEIDVLYTYLPPTVGVHALLYSPLGQTLEGTWNFGGGAYTATQTYASGAITTYNNLPVFNGGINLATNQSLFGDFSNANSALRTRVQSSTVNGSTILQLVPNGTGTTAVVSTYNGSDLDNSAYCYISHNSTEARLLASKTGTGVAKPLAVYANSIKAMTYTTTGSTTVEKTLTHATQYTHTTTTGSSTVDFANAQNIKLTMTGNCTLAFSFPGIGDYRLTVVSGANTITWPTVSATWQWLGATGAPTLNTGTYGGVVDFYYDGTMTTAKYTKIGAV